MSARRRLRAGWLSFLVLTALMFCAAAAAGAEGWRSITTLTGDYYFATSSTAASYYIEADQVLLIPLIPSLTGEAKVTRNEFTDGNQTIFYLGPVYSFAPTVYVVGTYGLGFDSTFHLIHEADAALNYETDLSSLFVSFKWELFTADGAWYILPSMGGRFHLTPQLAFFGEYFMSWNNLSQLTTAFWGQMEFAFTPVWTLLAGFTFSVILPQTFDASRDIGFSAIVGADLTLSEAVVLTYKFSFLSNVVQYLGTEPTTNYGIENLLSLDWKL